MGKQRGTLVANTLVRHLLFARFVKKTKKTGVLLAKTAEILSEIALVCGFALLLLQTVTSFLRVAAYRVVAAYYFLSWVCHGTALASSHMHTPRRILSSGH